VRETELRDVSQHDVRWRAHRHLRHRPREDRLPPALPALFDRVRAAGVDRSGVRRGPRSKTRGRCSTRSPRRSRPLQIMPRSGRTSTCRPTVPESVLSASCHPGAGQAASLGCQPRPFLTTTPSLARPGSTRYR
jgi:hypothetical protein